MSKHSPKPWSIEFQSAGFVEVRDRDVVAVFTDLMVDLDIQNLVHMVACVNACAGVSTAELESRKAPISQDLLREINRDVDGIADALDGGD